MLVLTVSRRDADGHSVPLIAVNDPAIVRQVLRAVTKLTADDEGEQSRIVALPGRKGDVSGGNDE